MTTVRALPVVSLLLAGCFWSPLGGARPRVGLEAVERSPGEGRDAPPRPIVEPGARGYFFSDSLIAFRTQADLASVRLRLWNRGQEPIRITWDGSGPAGEGARRAAGCPEAAGDWELRGSGPNGDAGVLDPGRSRESRAMLAARVGSSRGGTWESVRILCMVFDPVEPRAALRLRVETPTARFVYTFWYRLMEAPREDPPAAPAASAMLP
jgi:hypothetical protein